MDTNNETLDSSNATIIERPSNTSVAVTFASGVSVEISLRVGLLSFVVKLPDEFMMDSRGLLGNFDGNSTNEFVFRNGTMIPDNSTDREIHNFGQSCKSFHQHSIIMLGHAHIYTAHDTNLLNYTCSHACTRAL